MSMPPAANPDQVLIHGFIDQGGTPLAVNSNPMALALGLVLLKADRASGQVELSFVPKDLFVQGAGVIQGGAITAMLDFAMAFASLAALPLGRSCATVNLNVSFLRPAAQGRYIAVGQLERQGKTMAFANAKLLRKDDQVIVASASSTLAVF